MASDVDLDNPTGSPVLPYSFWASIDLRGALENPFFSPSVPTSVFNAGFN